jgi:hypothetical protein
MILRSRVQQSREGGGSRGVRNAGGMRKKIGTQHSFTNMQHTCELLFREHGESYIQIAVRTASDLRDERSQRA